MLQKDIEMSRILYRKHLSDDEKQKRQNDSTTPTVKLASNIDLKEEKVLPQEKEQLSDSVIVENIPESMRPRAVALLNRLKARPDVTSSLIFPIWLAMLFEGENILTALAQRNFSSVVKQVGNSYGACADFSPQTPAN